MELKVKINKEKFAEIESGKNELVVGLTQALLKKISKDESYTISDLISNKELIKHFDELCILCMFSSDMITLPIEEMNIEEDGIHFILKNGKKNVQIDEDSDETLEPEDNENDEKIKAYSEGKEIIEYEYCDGERGVLSISERINKEIEEFCKNNKVYVVGGPRVAIHPNGVVFGTKRKLPILNDVRFYIDIEKQIFYFTYDMTEDDFIEQLREFLKKMLINNFVFIWKKKCEYKEVDGKRFLSLYYTTRRYVNQTKKLL